MFFTFVAYSTYSILKNHTRQMFTRKYVVNINNKGVPLQSWRMCGMETRFYLPI